MVTGYPPFHEALPVRRYLAGDGVVVTEYLAFRVGDDLFALPLANVREILIPPPITLVPRAPHDVLGIISVRGMLVTVVDLRQKFKLTKRAYLGAVKQRILLVTAPSGEVMGLYVDAVAQVYRFADFEIEVAATILGSNVADYIAGIGRRDNLMILLLALAPLLAPAR